MDQVIDSKLTATQNIIRNKFEKAYTNRVDHEHDVNRTMNYLTSSTITDDLEAKNKKNSLRDLSKTTGNDTPQLRLLNKKKHRDPNVLCDNLRMLLTPLFAGDTNSMQLINDILNELRDLNIIV